MEAFLGVLDERRAAMRAPNQYRRPERPAPLTPPTPRRNSTPAERVAFFAK